MGKTRPSEGSDGVGSRSAYGTRGRPGKSQTLRKTRKFPTPNLRTCESLRTSKLGDASEDEWTRGSETGVDACTQTLDLNQGSLEGFQHLLESQHMQLALIFQKMGRPKPFQTLTVSDKPPEEHQLCPICSSLYENKQRLPVCLPCGHTICKICAGKMRTGCRFSCPFDRREFVSVSDLLPTNYLVLQVLEQHAKNREMQCVIHSMPALGCCLQDNVLVCGMCLFDHKDHECCAESSGKVTAKCQEKQKALMLVLEKANSRKTYWEQALGHFNILVMNFTRTSLGMYIDVKSQMPGMLPTYPEESTFMLIYHRVTEVQMMLVMLLDNIQTNMSLLEGQLEVFTRMSPLEKAIVQIQDDYDSCDFFDFLQHFGLLIEQVNLQFMPIVSAYLLPM